MSVKEGRDDVKVGKESVRWFHDNVNKTVKASKHDVGTSLTAVTELAQNNLTQIAELVELAFNDHKKRLVEQSPETEAQRSKNLIAQVGFSL